MPTNAVRSAERRCVPFAKGTRTLSGDSRWRAHHTERQSALRPLVLRGDQDPPRKGGNTKPAVGLTFAADDFAWLYDIVNRMRTRAPSPAVMHGASTHAAVMPGFMPGIHVFLCCVKQDVDGRDIGERSDAVLRTAMPGHDVER